jgi:SAM-dependent methyltransferase
MSDSAGSHNVVPEKSADIAERYKKDFWSEANLVFSQPHYRLEKALRIIEGLARGKECSLLDVGCGPATLMRLLPPNIHYYGIDLDTHGQAPNLMEADLLEAPIGFNGKKFDIVLAQGFFEYVGSLQAQKFAEIADILSGNGKFIVSYWNYKHRNTQTFCAHSNIQPVGDFRKDLERHFTVDRFFPASHNWYHGSPSMRLNKAINMHVNVNIPLISPLLAVEYFFICSRRDPRAL